jgi:hypothetical protein
VGTDYKSALSCIEKYPRNSVYYFSSARNYAGLENDLDIVVLDLLHQFG